MELEFSHFWLASYYTVFATRIVNCTALDLIHIYNIIKLTWVSVLNYKK